MVVLVLDVLGAAVLAGAVLIPAAACGAFYSCRLLRCLCLCLPVFAAWSSAVLADLRAAASTDRRRNRRGADGAAAFLRVAGRVLPVPSACTSGECECQETCDITWMVQDVILCLLDVAKSGWARDGDADLLGAWTRAVAEAEGCMRAFEAIFIRRRVYWGDYETVFERLRERAAPPAAPEAEEPPLKEPPLEETLLKEAPRKDALAALAALAALEAWRAGSIRSGSAYAGTRR